MIVLHRHALLIFSVISVSPNSTASAGALPASVAPISVRLALKANTITLGEPVVLDYDIADSIQRPVTVDLGEDQEVWLTVSIAPKSAAHRAVAVRSLESLRIGGISTSRVRPVTRPSKILGHIVVSRRMSFVGPGKYTLLVVVEIPYLIGGEAGTIVSMRPDYPKFTPPTGVLRLRRTLTLVVKPRDTARLHRKARSLIYAATVRGRNVVDALTAIQALFTMPPDFVAGEWFALFQNPELGFQTNTAIQEMARTGSLQAADILARVSSDPTHTGEVRATARAGLFHMWQQGGPPLKRQIANHFIRSEGRMPAAGSITNPVD
jgi:hypothetical protein